MGRTIRHPKTEPAEVEFPYVPAGVPVDPWGSFADPTLGQADRLAAAAYLKLIAAPCPHYRRDGERIPCSQADDHQPAGPRS